MINSSDIFLFDRNAKLIRCNRSRLEQFNQRISIRSEITGNVVDFVFHKTLLDEDGNIQSWCFYSRDSRLRGWNLIVMEK